jgi:hypothetical protein
VSQPEGEPPSLEEMARAQLTAGTDASREGLERAVSFVGTIVTALGAVKLPALHGLALALGTIAVICGVLSVAVAITSLTVSSRVFVTVSNDLELAQWYYRRVERSARESMRRASLTRASLFLLLATIVFGGVAVVISIVSPRVAGPAITVTQTIESASDATATSVTVKVTFSDVRAGDHLSVTVTRQGQTLSRAAATPAANGSATAALTINHVAAAQRVVINASTQTRQCQAVLGAAAEPTLNCHSR